MTVTPIASHRKSREVTVSYLGGLLFAAGFIDEKQRAEVENLDKQFRTQSRSKSRADDEASPFKALMGMNLTDASGTGTRIDDFLLARLIAEDAQLHFFKIDPLKLDVEMIEAKISRPFARKHKMVPVAVRDGKLIVSIVNPFDTSAVDTFRQMVQQEIELVVSAAARSTSATSSSTSSSSRAPRSRRAMPTSSTPSTSCCSMPTIRARRTSTSSRSASTPSSDSALTACCTRFSACRSS